MSDPITKTKALELAVQTSGSPADVVARAAAYHAFLTGTGETAGAKNPPKQTTAKDTGGQKASTETTKAAGATTAGKPNGAGAPVTGKPNGAAAGAAPGAGKSNANPVAGDTKAPGGQNNYSQMVATLTKVRDKSGKDECMKILKEDGGGAATVRDVKPALYDAVVEACNNVLADEGDSGIEDPTETPARDELGL